MTSTVIFNTKRVDERMVTVLPVCLLYKMPLRVKYKKCSFANCENNSRDHPNIQFFNFRKHDYNEWARACPSLKLSELKEVNIISPYYICGYHFP